MLEFIGWISGLVILTITLLIIILVVMSYIFHIIDPWINRRYHIIWYDLKSNGNYKVKKVLWNEGRSVGLLLYFYEGHHSGHAIYEYFPNNAWEKVPKEGNYLKPNIASYGMAPFEIVSN